MRILLRCNALIFKLIDADRETRVALPVLEFTTWQMLVLFQHELLLFAGVFFLLGALDDISVDLCWIWLRLTGCDHSDIVETEHLATANLEGLAALFIPAWNEAAVIGDTVAYALNAWPQDSLPLYVGCYRNDAATIQAVMEAAESDPRIRLVIHDREGPTTKADCLNRLYRALRDDERRAGLSARTSLDYRKRVAGDAEPASGVAMTLSTRF